MRTIIPALAAAGCSAVLLCATSARADEGHGERDRARTEAPAEPARFDHAEWFRVDQDHRGDRDRRMREIEAERERFYASWDGNQRARARLEAWYAQQCAELGR